MIPQTKGYEKHWLVGATAYPVFMLQCWAYGQILGWFFKSAKAKTTIPTWMMVACAVGFFIDDVGTGVGMQGEERPRDFYEANECLVNMSHKGQEWGIFRNHTDALRYHFFMGMAMIYFVWSGRIALNPLMKYGFFVFQPLTKVNAGYRWWGVKPNNFSVVDFFTFKEGRDCWERSSPLAVQMFNGGQSKTQYASALPRRRLVEGSKTFRLLDDLGWLQLLLPSVAG